MRQAMALLLVWLLVSPVEAAAPSDTVREQVLTLPRDSAVEVRFLDKAKRRGRLGTVNESGFELQTVNQGKIETVQVPFDQVKSVRPYEQKSTGRSIGRSALIAVIVVGTVIGILAIIGAVVGASD